MGAAAVTCFGAGVQPAGLVKHLNCPGSICAASSDPLSPPCSSLSVGTATEAQAPATPSTSTGTSADQTWISFTLVTSVLVGEFRGDERLKMDQYVYVPDPLSRGLTMAGVALHPKKYDSTESSPSAAERFAVLVGGVITPTGGVGIGASWMAARPVSLNPGLAVLLVNTAKDGKKALEVPTDLASPLETGVAYGWFVGANYNLGR